MQKVQCWLHPCMMLTKAVVVADAVAQVFADGRFAAGFIVRVHDLVPRTGQQGVEVFSGPVGFLGSEHEVDTGQLVDEFATPALGHAA